LSIFQQVGAQFGISSELLASELLQTAGIATVPGSAFGSAGEGYLRLSFAAPQQVLAEAVRRLDTFQSTHL